MQTTDTKSAEYNLGVLRKQDPRIVRVLHTAKHAVVYVYTEDEAADSPWERHNVEGALHIVERNVEPRYQLFIHNRLSTSNLVESITPDFSIEVSEEFLLYKNDEDQVLGLWFYEAADRDSTAQLIEKLVQQVSGVQQPAAAGPLQPASTAPAASAGGSSVEQFFALARVASSPPMTGAPPPAQPLPFAADAMGLLSQLQGEGAAPAAPSARPARPPAHTAPPAGSAAVLEPALRTAIRQALARVVQEERFMQLVEEEYAIALPAAAAAAPPRRAAAARPKAAAAKAAEPIDPKDGNALLQNLLSGLK